MSSSAVVRQLQRIVGRDAVLHRPDDLMLYEYDGSIERGLPQLVVFPQTTEQVCEVVKLANRSALPIIPRGAGTGLSGGAIARLGGIVLGFSHMNRILEIDAENERAVVQPGVVNLELSQAAAAYGYYFAPRPFQPEGLHDWRQCRRELRRPAHSFHGRDGESHHRPPSCPDARVVEMGGKAMDHCGYDLTGFFVGSEGTLGIATKIIVKLSRIPKAVATLLAIYHSVDEAANTVAAITAEGITPGALEMLDGWTLRAVEAATHAGYPLDSGAVLLIELEGLSEAVEDQAVAVARVCRSAGAREVRRAKDERERQLLWAGRKNAFGAIGRISPSYYVQDGVIPRSKVPATLRYIEEVGKRHGLTIGNIFHAGDGNLHPLILFDYRDPDQTRRPIK